MRELKDRRNRAIEALNDAWPKMGGSEEDIAAYTPQERKAYAGRSSNDSHSADPIRNGATNDAVVPMRVIREVEQNVFLDNDLEIVTQTDLKDRVLSIYPNGKIPSIRSAISHLLNDRVKRGEYELIEKGIAGAPNKYRKTGKAREENLLGP